MRILHENSTHLIHTVQCGVQATLVGEGLHCALVVMLSMECGVIVTHQPDHCHHSGLLPNHHQAWVGRLYVSHESGSSRLVTFYTFSRFGVGGLK